MRGRPWRTRRSRVRNARLVNQMAVPVEVESVGRHRNPRRYVGAGAGGRIAGRRRTCRRMQATSGAPRPRTFTWRRQVSWLADCRRCLAFPVHGRTSDPHRQQLSAYSCGGSPGFVVTDAPGSLLAPKARTRCVRPGTVTTRYGRERGESSRPFGGSRARLGGYFAKAAISAMIASPMSPVLRTLVPSDLMSAVRSPLSSVAAIAWSIRSASLPMSKE